MLNWCKTINSLIAFTHLIILPNQFNTTRIKFPRDTSPSVNKPHARTFLNMPPLPVIGQRHYDT